MPKGKRDLEKDADLFLARMGYDTTGQRNKLTKGEALDQLQRERAKRLDQVDIEDDDDLAWLDDP